MEDEEFRAIALGFHTGVANTAIGFGTKVETAHSIATGAEVGVGLVQLAPAVVATGRTVKTAAQRLAAQRGMIKIGPESKSLQGLMEALGAPRKASRLAAKGGVKPGAKAATTHGLEYAPRVRARGGSRTLSAITSHTASMTRY